MGIEVGGTIAGLERLIRRVDQATEEIIREAAHVFQAQAMLTAPVGTPGNSTNTPGDLRRSIAVDGPKGGAGVYTAEVGPTVTTANPGPGGTVFNYGRIREFGGTITPKVAPALAFRSFGAVYITASVTQVGDHYLLRARTEAQPEVEGLVGLHLSVAVEGG